MDCGDNKAMTQPSSGSSGQNEPQKHPGVPLKIHRILGNGKEAFPGKKRILARQELSLVWRGLTTHLTCHRQSGNDLL